MSAVKWAGNSAYISILPPLWADVRCEVGRQQRLQLDPAASVECCRLKPVGSNNMRLDPASVGRRAVRCVAGWQRLHVQYT